MFRQPSENEMENMGQFNGITRWCLLARFRSAEALEAEKYLILLFIWHDPT